MITLDLSILNQKGTPMFNSDLFANRPAAGIVGRIFISTDTKEFFRDTGTSWELIGGPGSGTITGSGAATQVAFWNGASTITGSNNLFWDSTNNYLGISTNTPTTALDVHHSTNSGAIFNQTTGTNNNTINFQTSGSGRWRIGNFYTAGADDFGIFDVVGSLQQFTISNTTGQTFIGAKTTAAGRLVVNSATADAHLQIVGANSPSIRIDNAGSGGTQRFVIGNATATNNFIQGSAAGNFCITTASASALLFGMWQTTNASEVMRITTANNLLVGSTVDSGEKFQCTGTAKIMGRLDLFSATSVGSGSDYYYLDNDPNLSAGANNQIIALTRLRDRGSDGAFTGVNRLGIIVENAGGGSYVFQLFSNTGNVRIGYTSVASTTTKLSIRGGSNDSSTLSINATANNDTETLRAFNSNQVIIGAGGTLSSSAVLQCESVTQGFLPPRLTTTEKNAISTPAAGLVVYDTTLNKLCVRVAAAWETITSI